MNLSTKRGFKYALLMSARVGAIATACIIVRYFIGERNTKVKFDMDYLIYVQLPYFWQSLLAIVLTAFLVTFLWFKEWSRMEEYFPEYIGYKNKSQLQTKFIISSILMMFALAIPVIFGIREAVGSLFFGLSGNTASYLLIAVSSAVGLFSGRGFVIVYILLAVGLFLFITGLLTNIIIAAFLIITPALFGYSIQRIFHFLFMCKHNF